MKQGIRTKIFIPVFFGLILFPAAAFGIFWLTCDGYMRRTAGADVERMIEYVQQEAGEEAEFKRSAGVSREGAKEAAKDLMIRIRKELQKGSQRAQLLVFNTKMREIYPDRSGETELKDYMAAFWREQLEAGGLIPGELLYMEAFGEEYAVKFYEVDSDYRVKTKYFLAYEQVPDMTQLLVRAGSLIFVIAAVLLFVLGLLVWMVSGSIVKSIRILCRQTAQIGTGAKSLLEEEFSTRELEQLRTAFCTMETRLEEAEEEKQKIFQNISHDLRTPLAAIIGYAEGIRSGVARDIPRAADIILTESKRMRRMVDSILTLSKLDSNAWQTARVKLPLGEFLDEQTDTLQSLAGEKQLILTEGEGDGLVAESDPELLTRIFQNVVSNCLRYAEQKVEIRLARQGEMAVIVIEDDGPGVRKEELEHIFERHYRGKQGEFGIGLSLVWTGMQYLGGRAEVSNKMFPEHGLVFRLFLGGLDKEEV